MDVLRQIWQWLLEAEAWEWVFSGVGLPIAGWLFCRYRKKPSAQEISPPVSNTVTHSGNGDQNIGKQENIQQDVRGNRNIISGGGNVNYKEEHHHHYPRTPQGIPLQRPKQAEHLVGRKDLLNDVLAALQPGKVVTLCGPGGIGKTALASRVAWELSSDGKPPAHFPDGLIFYSFYGRKDVSLAFDHLVRSFTDDSQDNNPEAVCHLLANKQALIILDGAEEADDLPAVLHCCGGCGVLITSRKRSDAPDSLFEVKPLDELPAEEAFRLYSRGTACCAPTTADETTVQAICQQLGGWPLALRLAGYYLRNTGESATEYLRWLEKEPFKELGDSEHQDENAALLLRRSVEQVSEDAQLALEIIGVLAFAPFTARPIVALLKSTNYSTPWKLCRWVKNLFVHPRTWLVHCSDNDLRFCRDVLNELVIFGLLEHKGEGWVVSHALIHTYVRSKMPLKRTLFKLLGRFYIAFAREQSKAGLEGYACLDEERVHCLRLIESCLHRELWQDVQDLEYVINTYLDRQGYWTEKLAALEMRLKAARKAGDRRDEAWCLNELGYTCDRRKELDKSLAWHEQSLPICRELEDRQGEGVTLNNIAGVYYAQGEYEHALQHYEQCLSIMREIGNKLLEGGGLNNIAAIYNAQGKPDKAVKQHKQALAIRQELGDRAEEAESCWNIGRTYEEMGDLAKAEEYIALAVEIAEAVGHPALEQFRNYLERLQAKRQGG